MRRTWVAYVVRQKDGRTGLLTYQIGEGDDLEHDDLPAGRIP
jgi:hypothetical protein